MIAQVPPKTVGPRMAMDDLFFAAAFTAHLDANHVARFLADFHLPARLVVGADDYFFGRFLHAEVLGDYLLATEQY